MNYGLQLYSVRDLTKESLEEAIEKVAKLGYKNVEFAGFMGRTAEQVNDMLAKNGVEVSGTHSSLDDLINNYDETVAFHKAIGNKYYILPSYRLSNQQEIDYFVEKVNEIMPKLEKDGITLAFHNHARECVPNVDGSVALEQMIYRTDIKLEIDTYWAYVGMKNPVELITRLKDRIVRIHVKDGFIDGKGMPLGMGTAPVKEVYEKAKELGFLMVVESETCTPSGMAEAEICINYLKSLE